MLLPGEGSGDLTNPAVRSAICLHASYTMSSTDWPMVLSYIVLFAYGIATRCRVLTCNMVPTQHLALHVDMRWAMLSADATHSVPQVKVGPFEDWLEDERCKPPFA